MFAKPGLLCLSYSECLLNPWLGTAHCLALSLGYQEGMPGSWAGELQMLGEVL